MFIVLQVICEKSFPFGLVFTAVEMKLKEPSPKSWPGLTTRLKNVQTWDFCRFIKFYLHSI